MEVSDPRKAIEWFLPETTWETIATENPETFSAAAWPWCEARAGNATESIVAAQAIPRRTSGTQHHDDSGIDSSSRPKSVGSDVASHGDSNRGYPRSHSRSSGCGAPLPRPCAKPIHGIEDQLVLRLACEGGRQLLVRFVVEIDVVVPHVEIDHPILDVGPDHGIVAAVPDFMRFWPGARAGNWQDRWKPGS